MANTIPNLWPAAAVSVDTLSPVAILRVQGENLTQMTHGLLRGEVSTTEEPGQVIHHHFDIVAPALNRYRHRILTIYHYNELIYPVYFDQGGYLVEDDEGNTIPDPRANTEVDFIHLLTGTLQSGNVLSVISSLIARSNEVASENERTAVKELQPA